MKATRDQVLRYRVHAQQLDRETGSAHTDADILDLGVQDTGNEGSRWALAQRGVQFDPGEHFIAWTLRGAPTAYRRAQAAQVAAATAPYDEADAAKRVFDAAKPLKAAGIPVLEALAVVSGHMRDIVKEPTVKGEMSGRLTAVLPDPYLRYCRPCDAIHSHEQTFRLSALPAGLELDPGTSPPVLRRIPGWGGPAAERPASLDPIRACLHLFGPLTPKLVAGYIDAPVRTVTSHWPNDVEEVVVAGERRFVLAADAAALADPPASAGVRLLGSHDLFLQTRDRELLVEDADRRKQLWPVLGRPGTILQGHNIVGTWRPRTSGKKLTLATETWTNVPKRELEDQAARLAEHRGQGFAGVA
ncbi:crosslink repair DNA glycosylase YcaQ family protein [Saxibacter everestensis]|uniref:Crosslink repair DNA glycosylase YcaQ family protein n=1 Tax=Saxibacter everestensis TaxID=2909229 RepID=A0ABY8QP27_9MICO|nr:crosslink repair DNA glycosylase YcaQ family protein [Brevibacteriaceae bacterium ZFBP1038]